MKNPIRSQRGQSLLIAVVLAAASAIITALMIDSSGVTMKSTRGPRVKSGMANMETGIRSLMLQPTTYVCPPGSITTCVLRAGNLLQSFDHNIPGCNANHPNPPAGPCGLKFVPDPTVVGPQWDAANQTLTGLIIYEGRELNLQSRTISIKVPADVLSPTNACTNPAQPLFQGFDNNGVKVCTSVPPGAGGNCGPGTFISNINMQSFALTCSALPGAVSCAANEYIDAVTWPGNASPVTISCKPKIDPFSQYAVPALAYGTGPAGPPPSPPPPPSYPNVCVLPPTTTTTLPCLPLNALYSDPSEACNSLGTFNRNGTDPTCCSGNSKVTCSVFGGPADVHCGAGSTTTTLPTGYCWSKFQQAGFQGPPMQCMHYGPCTAGDPAYVNTNCMNTIGNPVLTTGEMCRPVSDGDCTLDVGPTTTTSPTSLTIVNFCFVEGTRIAMAEGEEKNIEDVEIGEIVRTYDERTQEMTESPVTEVFHHPAKEDSLYEMIFTDENSVKSNGVHLFFVPQFNRYLEAQEIYTLWKLGEIVRLLGADNELKSVRNILKTKENVPLFNIHVASPYDSFEKSAEIGHNYFANGILAHNKPFDPSGFQGCCGTAFGNLTDTGGVIFTCEIATTAYAGMLACCGGAFTPCNGGAVYSCDPPNSPVGPVWPDGATCNANGLATCAGALRLYVSCDGAGPGQACCAPPITIPSGGGPSGTWSSPPGWFAGMPGCTGGAMMGLQCSMTVGNACSPIGSTTSCVEGNACNFFPVCQ